MTAPSPLESRRLVDAQHPWPGLEYFNEAEAGWFRGRDEEIEELHGRVKRRQLAVLFGQSGLGKTSLLRAGLFPRLRAERLLPVYVHLGHDENDPPAAGQVLDLINAALAEAGFPDLPPVAPGETLWERLHRRDCHPRDADGRTVGLVLVFDQFEELFTLGRVNDLRRARSEEFIAELAALVEDQPPLRVEQQISDNADVIERYDFQAQHHRVVFSLREDYLAMFETLKERIPAIMQNRMALAPMNGGQALAAVLGPGQEVIGEKVARQVVAFVAGRKDYRKPPEDLRVLDVAPSLLSLMCSELNTRRVELNLGEISAGLLAESSELILDDFYERCLAGQPAGVRVLVEDALLNDAGHRESISLERARKLLAEEGVPGSAIDELVKRRLLRLEERHDVQRVEITHDVLTSVIRKSAQARHDRIKREEAERRQASEERLRHEAESRAAEAHRKFRILLTLVIVAAAALVAAVIFGVQSRVNARRAEKETAAAVREAKRAEGSETAAKTAAHRLAEQEQRSRDAAADSLTELGRREVLAGQPLRALPCLVEALQYDGNRPGLNFLAGRALGAIDSLVASCEGHAAGVTFALFSPDGRWIVTGSPDATAKIWDSVSGKLSFSLDRHHDSITAAAFSPDGSRLAIASRDSQASIYDPVTGDRLHVIEGHSLAVNAIAFSPDGALLATASADGTAAIWRVADATKVTRLEGHGDAVLAIAFNQKGSQVVTASADKTARIWAVSGGPGKVLSGHGGQVLSVEFDSGGTRIVTASADGTAGLWDASKHMMTARFVCESPVTAAHFSPDGGKVVITCTDGSFRLGDGKGKMLCTLSHGGGDLRDARFSPDGGWVASAGYDGTARLWDARSGLSVFTFSGHAGPLNSVAFSADGRRIVTAGTDSIAKVWSLDAARLPRLLTLHHDALTMAAYSPDGNRIVTASHDNTARLWDPKTGAPVGPPLSQGDFWVLSAVFSPDSSTLVTAGGKSARFWHSSDGSAVRDADGKPVEFSTPGLLGTAAFMPDGKSVLLGEIDDPGQWSQWDISAGTQLLQTKQGVGNQLGRVMQLQPHPSGPLVLAFGSHRAWLYHLLGNRRWQIYGSEGSLDVMCAAMREDGRVVATGCVDGRIEIYTVMAQRLRILREAHVGAVLAVKFSADGKRLLSGGNDGRAIIWDAESGLQLVVLEGHEGAVRVAGFDPSGTFAVTGGADGQARVWEVSSGKLLANFGGHADVIRTAMFSPDGRQLLTASRDGTARIWPIVNPGLLGNLTEIAARVNAEVPYHLEQSRLVPGRMIDGSLAYDRTGHLQRKPTNRQEAGLLHEAGKDLAAARSALADNDPLAALAWLGKARAGNADWFSARLLMSASLPAVDGLLSAVVGHEDRIEGLSLSPDGRLAASAALDGTAMIWEASSGRAVVRLGGYKDWLFSASFSPDSQYVIASGREGVAHVHDVRTGRIVATMDNARARLADLAEIDLTYRNRPDISMTAFSADGTQVLMSCRDGTLRIWEARTGRLLRSIHGGGGGAIIVSPDGGIVAVAHLDGSVGLHDAGDFKERFHIPPAGEYRELSELAFSPDGHWLGLGSATGLVRLVEVSTGNVMQTSFQHQGAVRAISFSPDSSLLVTAGEDSTARVWRVLEKLPGCVFRGHSGYVISAHFSPDGKIIATAASDRTVRLWESVEGTTLQIFSGHPNPFVKCAFSADGKRVLCTSGTILRTWEVNVLKIESEEKEWTGGRPFIALAKAGTSRAVHTVAVGPRGPELTPGGAAELKHPLAARLFFFSGNGKDALTSVAILPATRLASPEGGQESESAFREWHSSIGRAAFEALNVLPQLKMTMPRPQDLPKGENSPGEIAKTLGVDAVLTFEAKTFQEKKDDAGGKEGEVTGTELLRVHATLTDAASGTMRWDLAIVVSPGEYDLVGAKIAAAFLAACPLTMQFSADGGALALQAENGVQVVEPETGRVVALLPEPPSRVVAFAFSGDRSRLAAAGEDGTIAVWDVGKASRLACWKSGASPVQAIHALALDEKGIRLLSAEGARVARLWDVASGAESIILTGHQGKILDVALDASGQYALTGSDDKTARLWDTNSGRAVGKFTSKWYPVTGVALSPDGASALIAENDIVHVWDTVSGLTLFDLPKHPAPLQQVAFSSDGESALSVDSANHIRLRQLLRPVPSLETLRRWREELLPGRVDGGRYVFRNPLPPVGQEGSSNQDP